MNQLVDLDGINTAKVLTDPASGTALLIIMAPSGFAENGTYFPAESIRLDSVDGIIALRDVLSQAIESLAKAPQPRLPPLPRTQSAPTIAQGGIKL